MNKILLIFFVLPLYLIAQETKQSAWDIDIDPLAYLLNGYSVHLGYEASNIRYDIGVFGLTVPEWSHGKENFEHLFNGFGMKADYLFDDFGGLFLGSSFSVGFHEYKHLPSSKSISQTHYSLSGRTGYRFFIGDHFMISPWFSVGYQLNDTKQIVIENEPFKEKSKIRYFLTVHVGWKF